MASPNSLCNIYKQVYTWKTLYAFSPWSLTWGESLMFWPTFVVTNNNCFENKIWDFVWIHEQGLLVEHSVTEISKCKDGFNPWPQVLSLMRLCVCHGAASSVKAINFGYPEFLKRVLFCSCNLWYDISLFQSQCIPM